jgi:membrane-bound ClpP family serine protease
MTVYTIYLFCLVVGLVFTLLSSMGHAEAGADSSDMPGVSIFSPTIIAAFITAFGGFGIIFTEIPATSKAVVSAPLSILAAFAIAGCLYKLLAVLFSHTQSSSESHVAALVGADANVITPIPEKGVGEIAYVISGTRYTAPARSEDGAAVANGRTVKITRIIGTQFYVQ